jgi:NAD(P)-dependent dehydrogenase (short-subunit alcohol dehydrogenase family)
MKKMEFNTGCSLGIGKAAAIYFAGQDWNVIATMRTAAASDRSQTETP